MAWLTNRERPTVLNPRDGPQEDRTPDTCASSRTHTHLYEGWLSTPRPVSIRTFQCEHLVTTSLTRGEGQCDGRCVQTSGRHSSFHAGPTITTDSRLTVFEFQPPSPTRSHDDADLNSTDRQWTDDTQYSRTALTTAMHHRAKLFAIPGFGFS